MGVVEPGDYILGTVIECASNLLNDVWGVTPLSVTVTTQLGFRYGSRLNYRTVNKEWALQ